MHPCTVVDYQQCSYQSLNPKPYTLFCPEQSLFSYFGPDIGVERRIFGSLPELP